jgi:hypothetical protein
MLHLGIEAAAVGKAKTSDRRPADLEEWRERTEWPAHAPATAEFEDVNHEEQLLQIPIGSRLST